jgi:hypothetical protein
MTLLHHSKILLLMSEMGQKRKGSNRAFHVRFAPDSGGRADILDRQLSAKTGLMHRSKNLYSIAPPTCTAAGGLND